MSMYDKNFWSKYHSKRLDVIRFDVELLKSGQPTYEIPPMYMEAMEHDIEFFYSWYKQFSGLENTKIRSPLPFDFQVYWNSNFDAYVKFDAGYTQTEITITGGLIISLYDLMMRICCNQAVLGIDAFTRLPIWEGTECLWPESESMPEIRFALYRPVVNEEFGKYTNNTVDNALANFHCGVPVGDEDRLYLANLMDFLSATWISFHEEAHYWQGHLHYLDEIGDAEISETSHGLQEEELFKIFEWQADRCAIIDLMNMCFVAASDEPFELPGQMTGNKLSWCIRIIICAIGSTIMTFQKVKLINGSEDHYPSPATRMCTMVAIVYSRLMIIMEEKGNVSGVTDKGELEEIIIKSFYSALEDLLTIEDIFSNYVDFEGGIQRITFEKGNPKSLLLIEESENIQEIILGILRGLQSDDKHIREKWFDEYNSILAKSDRVNSDILAKYQARTVYEEYRKA